ncbi:MAG: hypothetical protein HUK15_07020, partial [Bacteroidales bacterium]|nr:hypothetical protein [Bacteroidales bacterium]
MKKLLYFGLLFSLASLPAVSQTDDLELNPFIVPTQIFNNPSADSDTASTLVAAEGQEAKVAYNAGITLF